MKSKVYKTVVIALLLLTMSMLTAYPSEPQGNYAHRITQLTKQIYKQKLITEQIKNRLSLSEKRNDYLASRCDSLSTALDSLTANTFTKISAEQKSRKELENKAKSHINKTVIVMIALSVLILLALVLIFILRNKFKVAQRNLSDNEDKWSNDIKMVKEHLVDFDNKFLERLSEGLKAAPAQKDVEVDHTLPLRVADEISRMETNLNKMDSSVRGYKQLQKGIERIKNYYQAQGYDIVEMLGKPYNEGMLVNADFSIDEQLPEGTQIITSVKKPQVNYHGTMIQKATIIVSQNI